MKLQIKPSYFRQDISRREYAGAALGSAAFTGMIAYLYYGTFGVVFLMLPIGIWRFKRWEKECLSRKKQEFAMQFKEAIQSLSAALNVGYSVENAMKEAKKDLDLLYGAHTPIHREFGYMQRQLCLHVPVEQIFIDWSNRVGQEDVTNFAAVFLAAKKSGGDVIEIIRSSVTQITDKLEVKQEIETLLAAKRYEFKVMSGVPFGIIAYMKLSFPEFMDKLYGNALGIGVMSICLLVYLAAHCLGEKIINIEV